MNFFQITVGMLQNLFGSGKKSESAGRRSSGDDSVCCIARLIPRCKPEAAGAPLTAVPNIRGAKEAEKRER